jgi:hypothetical protein
MFKLFVAAVTAAGLSAVGTFAAASHFAHGSQPALPEATRAQARHDVTCAVIDSDLSLVQAAARFRELNQQAPAIAGLRREIYQAETEEECACLQVIAFVRTELEGHAREAEPAHDGETAADPGANVLARLQAELAAARGEDGKVRLPGDAN